MFRRTPVTGKTNLSPRKPERLLLLFSRLEILVVDVNNTKGQILLGSPQSYAWTASSLSKVLTNIQSAYQVQKVNILIGHDLALVQSYLFSTSEKSPTKKAEIQNQAVLGSEYEAWGIDYQELALSPTSNAVQMFMVKRAFLNILGAALQTANLEVDTIDPLGFAFETLIPKSPQPVLCLWGDKYLYTTLIVNQQVLYAATVNSGDIYKQIQTLLSSLEQRYKLKINHILMGTSKLDKDKLEATSKKPVTTEEINPFVGAVADNEEFKVADIFVEDGEGLSDETTSLDLDEEILPGESETESGIIDTQSPVAPKLPLKTANTNTYSDTMESVAASPNRSNAKLIAILVMVLVVLVGMVVGGFFVYQNAMSEANTPPEQPVVTDTFPTPTPDPVATDSAVVEPEPEEELDRASLSVNILNGSGTPGAAGVVSDLLEDAGFTQTSTGNADSYDYQETVIRVKANQTSLYQAVLTALQGDYTVTQGDPLPANNPHDVIVIVGQN